MDNPISRLLITLCYICYYDKLNLTADEFKANSNSYLSNCNRVFAMPSGGDELSHLGITTTLDHDHDDDERLIGVMSDQYLQKCLNDEETIKRISSDHEIRVTSSSSYDGLFNLTTMSSLSSSNPTTTRRCDGNKNTKSSSSSSVGGSMYKVSSKYGSVATISLIILYSLTVVIAILGNLLVIVVMCCGFRSSFLDISIYLMNLSVFNLLMAIFCIPFTFINTLVGKWIFSYYMCPFTNFVQMLSVNGCIFTLTALAINRFFAVAYPLKYNAMRTKRQKRISLIIVWIAAIGISSIQLFIYKCHCTTTDTKPVFIVNANVSSNNLECVENTEEEEEERDCRCLEIWDSNAHTSATYYMVYTVWIFMQTYCIPVLILVIMYSRIISILRSRNNTNAWRLQENSSGSNQAEQNEHIRIRTKKTIRMLCVVILSFCINWLPIHIFYLFLSFADYLSYNVKESETSLSVLFFVCHWLSMSNSFINPIIYSFMNHRFKTDLNHLLHCNKLEKKKKYQSSINRINELRLAESPSIHAHLNNSRLVVFSNNNNKAQTQILLNKTNNKKLMNDNDDDELVSVNSRRGGNGVRMCHTFSRHGTSGSPVITASRLTLDNVNNNNSSGSNNLMYKANRRCDGGSSSCSGGGSSVRMNASSCCELNSSSSPVINANRIKSTGGGGGGGSGLIRATVYKGSKMDL